MEVTIYNLVGPLGTVHSYTEKKEAEKEAEKRFNLFGDPHKVEETSLTVNDLFFSRINQLSKEEKKKNKKIKKVSAPKGEATISCYTTTK